MEIAHNWSSETPYEVVDSEKKHKTDTMNAAQKIIEQMPEQFTRQDVLKCAKEFGYSYSTANGVLDLMVYEDLAERIQTGLYRKLEPETEPDELNEDFEYEYEDDEDFEYE